MALPAVTYSLTNGTTADASQVNQNFTDLINAMTDGTKSFSIDALTVAGTALFNGAVTLGNGSPDDISFSGSLASSIPIKTTNSFDIGSSTLGLQSIYFGSSGGAFSTRIKGAAVASSWTLTTPLTAGNDGEALTTNGAGVTTWTPVGGPNFTQNYSLAASVGSSALTVALKDAAGSDPSSTSPVRIAFRSATAATGTVTVRSITSALSVTVTSGATLGHTDAHDDYVYVYAIDNAGTVELAVAGSKLYDDGARVSTTAVTSGADSCDVLYATSNRSNVAVRFLGRIQSNQTTAGTYAASPTEIASQNVLPPILTEWMPESGLTFSAFGTTSGEKFWQRRIGDTLQVRGYFSLGTVTGSTASINLPAKWRFDTKKMGTATNIQHVGMAIFGRPATTQSIFALDNAYVLFYDGSTDSSIYFSVSTGGTANQISKAVGTSLSPNNGVIHLQFEIPISGWSATR